MFVSTARGRAFSSCPCDSLLPPQLSLGRNLLVFAGCLTLALRQVRAAAQRARPHGPRPGHEVAYASSARGLWCSGACMARGGGSRGGRSCLVFSTHDRAGEVKRTGGSEVRRRTSGPEEWPTHPARGVCGVREQMCRVSREQFAYIYLRRVVRGAAPHFVFQNFQTQ